MKLSNKRTFIVDYVVDFMNEFSIGKENIMDNTVIREKIKQIHNVSISDREFREVISMIRQSWKIKNLIAGTNGYFIATTKSDIDTYLDRLKGIIDKNQIIVDSFDYEDILDPGKELKEKEVPNDDW